MLLHRLPVLLFRFSVNEVCEYFKFISFQISFFILGCNPNTRNLEGLSPIKIADQYKVKDGKKNIRKAEKGYFDMTINLRLSKFVLFYLFFV